MDSKLCLYVILMFITVLIHEIVAQRPSFCELPAERGPCRASLLRYAYNAVSGQCENFTYGGCMGNDNNFRTMEECEAICGKFR